MEAAARLADAGDLEGGRAALQNAKRKIALSSSADHPLNRVLVAECDTVEAGFADRAMYRNVGSKMSKMSAMSHGRQRATHMNQEAYRSAGANKAKLMASWSASLGRTGN